MREENPVSQFMRSEKFMIGISELSQMTDVSPRQLRYWEKKGYITSIQKNENTSRKFTLFNLMKIIYIKTALDKGYTLSAAVEKVEHKMAVIEPFRQLLMDRFNGLEEIDGTPAINLGYFDESEQQYLYAIIDAQKTRFKLIDVES